MLASLILPAIYAGIAVFVCSSIIWMFIGWHNNDLKPLPDEDGFMESLAKHSIPPGLYMWPNCHKADLKSDAFKEKWTKGPWGTINVQCGQPNFARNLIGTLIVNILIAFAIAASIGMVLNSEIVTCAWCQIFTPALILGVMTYSLGSIGNDLFLGKPCRFMATCILDGVIYAVAQAFVLQATWPA